MCFELLSFEGAAFETCKYSEAAPMGASADLQNDARIAACGLFFVFFIFFGEKQSTMTPGAKRSA